MHFFQQVINEFKKWDRGVQLFFAANLLYQLGSGMFSTLYNLYVESLGHSEHVTGSIISLQSLASALVFIPIGFLGDRKSRKMILILGALFSGASLIARSFAESEQNLLWLAFFSGLFVAVFQVIAMPYLAQLVVKEQRLKLFSYHFAFVLAAQVLGSIAGGYLADLLQYVGWSKTNSLQVVMFISGIFTLAAFIPMLFVSKRVGGSEQSNTPATTLSDVGTSSPVVNTSNVKSEWVAIGFFVLTQLLTGIGSGLVVPYLNLYFSNRFNVSLTAISLLISLGQVMTIVSMLIGPSVVKRFGPVRAIVYFQLLSLPFLLLTGYSNLLLVACMSFLFRQALMNAANPIHSSVIADRVSDSRRGIANSLTQTAFMLGWAVTGAIQSNLVTTYGTYWGYAITFSITGVLYVTSAMVYWFAFRDKKTIRERETKVLEL
ncbi:MFS transporter [Paenibacillus sp. KN14-4R]|uniref:MFS transporter n=1 Tax=Paenibacillus sp. KN14-4R TaxID=3445773 RepID=UPI003F9FDEFB